MRLLQHLAVVWLTFVFVMPALSQDGTAVETQDAVVSDSTEDSDGWWQAAQQGDAEEIARRLQQGWLVDKRTDYGATALMFAAGKGHVEVVKMLLDAGADPNLKDRFYSASPMRWAAMKNHAAVAVLLIQSGSKDSETALRMAISANDLQSFKQLVKLIEPSQAVLGKLKSALPKEIDVEFREYFASVPELDKSGSKTADAWKPAPRELELYAGRYALQSGDSEADVKELSSKSDRTALTVTVEDDKLVLQAGQPVQLRPLSKDVFQFGEATIRFSVREQQVVSLIVESDKREEYVPVKTQASIAEASHEPQAEDLAVSSADWMQFRGQGARGVAEGQSPPITWNVPEGKNVLWKQSIPGLAHACPIVAGNRLFVSTAISQGEDQGLRNGLYGDVDSVENESPHSFELLCLDKWTGEILWSRVSTRGIPKVKRHLKGTHANPTPVTNGERVVAFFGGEGLYCYDMDGELEWQRNLGTLDSGWFFDASYQWGFAASPIIFEDLVILQCDVQNESFVAALELSSGEEVWRTPREEIPSWSTPTVVSTSSGPQLITNATNYARAYNPRTGEELWRVGKHSEIVVPTPFAAHGLIYIASGYRPIKRIFAIKETARGDFSESAQAGTSEFVAWTDKNAGPYMVTPVCYGDYFYTCDSRGVFTCLDARSGERIYRKRISTKSATSFVGSLVAGDGHVYVPSEEGVMLVIKAGANFEVVAENPLGELMLSTPAISDGVMYLRGQSNLVAIQELDSTENRE